jgi:hypothetical protein
LKSIWPRSKRREQPSAWAENRQRKMRLIFDLRDAFWLGTNNLDEGDHLLTAVTPKGFAVDYETAHHGMVVCLYRGLDG